MGSVVVSRFSRFSRIRDVSIIALGRIGGQSRAEALSFLNGQNETLEALSSDVPASIASLQNGEAGVL